MLRSYKTEIKPTAEQIHKINCSIGTCRFVYNFFLMENQKRYEKEKKFLSGYDFQKWLNNEYIPKNPEYAWIKETSSKAVKQSIMNADRAYRRFFDGKAGFPRFKKKGKSEVKMYFVKTDKKAVIHCERHRIRIPTIGWVRLKEKNYIPTDAEHFMMKSGHVSKQGNRYYVSVLVEQEQPWYKNSKKCSAETTDAKDRGIGIDLGMKELAVCSDGNTYKNINKSGRVRKLEKQKRRIQKGLSRMIENQIIGYTGSSELKNRKPVFAKPLNECRNYQKRKEKLKGISRRLANIRHSYTDRVTSEIVNQKPKFLCIEDLNVKGMMKNKHLSKAVAQQNFYEFRREITYKTKWNGISLIIADRWFPSSKLCSSCGQIRKDLKLSDRIYVCPVCGIRMDRDFQASINLERYGDKKICKRAF